MPKCKSSTMDSEARKSMASPASARTQLTSPSTISLTSTHTSAAMPPPHLTLASLGLEPVAEHTFHSGHAAARPHTLYLNLLSLKNHVSLSYFSDLSLMLSYLGTILKSSCLQLSKIMKPSFVTI